MISENPEIFETPDGKVDWRGFSWHRPDQNYLRVTTGGLKLSEDEKKFWKNNQKIAKKLLIWRRNPSWKIPKNDYYLLKGELFQKP